MSVVERMDMLSSALPRKCLYCVWGYPVVFGETDWLESLVCGKWAVNAFKTKRIRLVLTERSAAGRAPGYFVAPVVGPWDACEEFTPVKMRPTQIGEFCNAKKFYLLDRSGLFDDMEASCR